MGASRNQGNFSNERKTSRSEIMSQNPWADTFVTSTFEVLLPRRTNLTLSFPHNAQDPNGLLLA